MLRTSNGQQIELQNFTEVVIANEMGLDSVIEYRKHKALEAVKNLREAQEKREAKRKKIEAKRKRIAELRERVEGRKELLMVA